MKITQIGETYSAFEKTDDPIENMRRRGKIFIFILGFFCIVAMIVLNIIENMPSKYTGQEEYYEIDGLQIPTLYKYTNHTDVFMVKEINNFSEGDMKGSYVSIFYNTKISENIINIYLDKLKELGYEKVIYEDTALYVKNNEENTKFIYIIVEDLQVKYGVIVSGKYENILK